MQECRKCGVELTDENWYPSHIKNQSNICCGCEREYQKQWRKANQDKTRERQQQWQKAHPERNRANAIKYLRSKGVRPYNENPKCSQYLGIHVAERVLSLVFKDVVRMPMGNPGYDIICNRNKLIDIKCSTLHEKKKNAKSWDFHIRHNTITDYFLCLAFDNRKDLTPLHAWLLPGSKFNQFVGISISQSTIHKWDEYALDMTRINQCCNAIR